MPLIDERLLARRSTNVIVDRRSDAQVVPLRVAVVDERAVGAERRDDGACEPSFQSSLNIVPPAGLTRRGEEVLAERLRVAGADVADRLDAGRLRGGVRRRDRDRVEVVLRGDRVVGVVQILSTAPRERCDVMPGGEHGDDGHEREADHQRGGGRRRALRVSLRVVARELRGRRAVDVRRPRLVPEAVVDLVEPAERDDEQEDEPEAGEQPLDRRPERPGERTRRSAPRRARRR